MASDETRIEAAFGDGKYVFWLALPQVVELERGTGTSILTLEDRLRPAIGKDMEDVHHFLGGGAATVKEIREVIRLALIGGNSAMVDGEEIKVGPNLARELVDSYVFPARPLAEAVVLAWRILHAAIYGIQLKKKPEAPAPDPLSPSEKDS